MDMFLVFLSLVDIFLLENGENKVKNAAHLKYVNPNTVSFQNTYYFIFNNNKFILKLKTKKGNN